MNTNPDYPVFNPEQSTSNGESSENEGPESAGPKCMETFNIYMQTKSEKQTLGTAVQYQRRRNANCDCLRWVKTKTYLFRATKTAVN